MKKYIPLDDLAVEIERILDNSKEVNNTSYVFLCNHLKSFIDTLEVKRVDLDRLLKENVDDIYYDLDGITLIGATHYLTVNELKDIAKHFFNLGMAVSDKEEKGEEV